MNFSLDKSDKLLYNFEKIRIFTFTAFAIFAKLKGTRLDIDFRARRTTIQWYFHVLTALAKLSSQRVGLFPATSQGTTNEIALCYSTERESNGRSSEAAVALYKTTAPVKPSPFYRKFLVVPPGCRLAIPY